jgi:hypothetical protein
MNSQTKQRYISTSIWSDDWFDGLTPIEKLVYFYLLTNERSNIVGIYPCTLKNIRVEMGITREEIEAIMSKFAEAGKAFHFKCYVIIPKGMKHQKLRERPKLFLAARAILISLPKEVKEFILNRKELFEFEEFKEFQAALEDIVDGQYITTHELSQTLGISKAQALRLGNELFEGKIENGKPTLWSEYEVGLLREYLYETDLCEGHAKVIAPHLHPISRPSHFSCEGHREICEGHPEICEGHAKLTGDSDSDSDSDSKIYINSLLADSSREEKIEPEKSAEIPKPKNQQQQQQIFSQIKNVAKTLGFFLTDKQAADFSFLDPAWLSGKHNFLVFAASKLKTDPAYAGKPRQELERLFLRSWKYQNWVAEYPV